MGKCVFDKLDIPLNKLIITKACKDFQDEYT